MARAGGTGRRGFCIGAGAALGLSLGDDAARAQQAEAVVAETRTGRLSGLQRGEVAAFMGIPYAAPPVGELRYRGPQPIASWAGLRDATRPGPASIQTLAGAAAWLYEGAEPQSEDCLFLNVWTPSVQGRRPVMVWFHGGAWRTGHGAVAGTDGTALARRGDVVVVTVNYRLGALGWLGHPALRDPETGAFANWGLQDQVAALRWVRDNIAGFGGDPGRVTIFGQSAGGQAVASLAQNPAHAGLIHGAVVESGSLHGAPGFPEPDTAAAYAEALAKRLNTTVPGLRDLPARQVHEAELALGRDPAMVRALGRPPVLPVLDGASLKVWPRDGAFAPVPLLIGTTRNEAVFWYDLVGPDGKPIPGLRPPATDLELTAMIRDLAAIYRPEAAGIAPEAVAEAYRRDAGTRGEGADPKSLWLSAYTDIVFRLRALAAATRHVASGHPAYLYEFAHPLAPPAHGVPHTAEIPFVFGTYAHPFFAAKTGAGEAEAELSATMLAAWARFAHDGVPAAPGAGEWTRLGADGAGVNVLGGPDGPYRVERRVRADQLAAWGV